MAFDVNVEGEVEVEEATAAEGEATLFCRRAGNAAICERDRKLASRRRKAEQEGRWKEGRRKWKRAACLCVKCAAPQEFCHMPSRGVVSEQAMGGRSSCQL